MLVIMLHRNSFCIELNMKRVINVILSEKCPLKICSLSLRPRIKYLAVFIFLLTNLHKLTQRRQFSVFADSLNPRSFPFHYHAKQMKNRFAFKYQC